MKKFLSLSGIIALVMLLAYQCDHPKAKKLSAEKEEKLLWLNHHDTVSYVGVETCMQCHSGIHQTFIQTGMGQSIGKADTLKSIAKIDGHQKLYDSYQDLYYQPFWRDNTLVLREFRLGADGDTLHNLVQPIDYVIGSGQHTNSHLWQENGYYFQAPFTWYAQEQKLDFPPGFEEGKNSRFNRQIGLECMACHNAMPTEFVKGSTQKFRRIPEGINCERCHGPGGAHVAKIMRGEITDTAKEADRSIVNPKRLSAQMQFEICQRCHLQGNAVLKEGKSFFDFKPGMELKEVMQVFLPRYEDSDNRFIMASHADRFKLSACYQAHPETFTCTSCHNPHISVMSTVVSNFNQTCIQCHSANKAQIMCSAPMHEREVKHNNCVQCHMPPSQATDIPHVTVHDHFIRKPQDNRAPVSPEASRFLALLSINDSKPSARDKALAYLQQFERFGAKPLYLDSAARFLNEVPKTASEHLYLWTYYFFLSGDRESLYHFGAQYGLNHLLRELTELDYENKDAWTAYRLAEAYQFKGDTESALKLFERSVDLAPFIGDFKNKWAALLNAEGQKARAESLWKEVLQEEPYHRESLNNIAFLMLEQGRNTEAAQYLKLCLERYPDYLLAWQNEARRAMQSEDALALKRALEAIIRLDPQNVQAKEHYRKFFS